MYVYFCLFHSARRFCFCFCSWFLPFLPLFFLILKIFENQIYFLSRNLHFIDTIGCKSLGHLVPWKCIHKFTTQYSSHWGMDGLSERVREIREMIDAKNYINTQRLTSTHDLVQNVYMQPFPFFSVGVVAIWNLHLTTTATFTAVHPSIHLSIYSSIHPFILRTGLVAKVYKIISP